MANQKEEILAIIKDQQAALVNVGGRVRIFTMDNINEIPNEADLAAGNPEQEKAALESIDAQIKALEESKKRLAANQKAVNKAADAQTDAQVEEAAKAEAESVKRAEAKEEAPRASAKKEESK